MALNGTDIMSTIKSATGFGNVPDAYTMITTLGTSLDPILALVGALSYCFGIFMVLNGIHHLYKAGINENGNETPSKALMIIFLGALLVYLTPTIHALTFTAFGEGASANPLGYTVPGDVSAKVATATAVIYKFIGIVGVAAIVRGVMIFKYTTEGKQDASIAKGWWHFIGGVAAIHLDAVVGVMKATVGM